ncbi:MAG: hypothetical protein AB7V50_05020 [Vampirovibrionia bacterium]
MTEKALISDLSVLIVIILLVSSVVLNYNSDEVITLSINLSYCIGLFYLLIPKRLIIYAKTSNN